MLKIIETVRDGFQGLDLIIPTVKKNEYINALLKVGFDSIDIGSFVSRRAVPQMADTTQVIKNLDLSKTNTKIMVLAGNVRGAKTAACFEQIDQIIYPFSISETFLKKNINANFISAESQLDNIVNVCFKKQKELIVYLAMGFGNPYGDIWNIEIVIEWIEKLVSKGIKIIPLSDNTGESTPQKINEVYSTLIPIYPEIEFGFHLHTNKTSWYEKVDAAYQSGCRRFDTVLGGIGGCPFTGYELLSNLNTLDLKSYLDNNKIGYKIDSTELENCNSLIQNLI